MRAIRTVATFVVGGISAIFALCAIAILDRRHAGKAHP